MHLILDRILSIRLPFLHFSGGEPLLREDLFELAHRAKRGHVLNFLHSNGSLFTEETALLADRDFFLVLLSLDGSARHHEILRGKGTFAPALRGLELLLQARSRMRVGITCVLSRFNVDGACSFLDFLEPFNLDRVRIYPHFFPEFRPSPAQVAPVIEKLLLIYSKRPGYLIGDPRYFLSWTDLLTGCKSSPCEAETLVNHGLMHLGILPDGVLSACSTFNAPLGNLLDSSFDEILNSDITEKIRRVFACNGCIKHGTPLVRYLFEQPLKNLNLFRIFSLLQQESGFFIKRH